MFLFSILLILALILFSVFFLVLNRGTAGQGQQVISIKNEEEKLLKGIKLIIKEKTRGQVNLTIERGREERRSNKRSKSRAKK